MHLVLFRHGIAQDKTDPDGPPDPERRLIPKGIARTRKAARGLRRLGLLPGLVLTSPYLRAKETAELAVAELGLDQPPVQTDALLPDAEPDELLAYVASSQDSRQVEVVLCAGHAPNLDRVVARLLGADHPVTELDKAGAACFELLPGGQRGRLEWLLDNRQLRRLKK